MLVFYVLAFAATITGLAIGVVEGRRRRRFAHGRWTSMSVVGLCAPWALLAYALGYGLGRLLPAPRSSLIEQTRLGGWQQAVQLYATLASGQKPPAVFAPDLMIADAVYMDVRFSYSRFYAMEVTYEPGVSFAVGSPALVASAAIGSLIGTTIGYARAASLSRQRWRDHRLARVVVTSTATWCQGGGWWLCFEHAAVEQYMLDANQSCILTFRDTDPLRLHGPSAWCHAVLFTYLRYGAGALQTAPFLYPLRQAA